MVHDHRGDALTEFTVIAFPTDERLWQPQSRHIMAIGGRNQNACIRFVGYRRATILLSVVDEVEEGEWFDPRFLADLRQRAARVTLRGWREQGAEPRPRSTEVVQGVRNRHHHFAAGHPVWRRCSSVTNTHFSSSRLARRGPLRRKRLCMELDLVPRTNVCTI